MNYLAVLAVLLLSLSGCKQRTMQSDGSSVAGLSAVKSHDYPMRNGYQLKAIQPDFWPNKDELSGNGTGGVAMNLVWYMWEPSSKAPPCADNQQEYDGHCFNIDPHVDPAIREWTERGVYVTAVVYGVPEWARQGKRCVASPGFETFCAPTHASDYARFAGMLAKRYNGDNGHGRIFDFVIHNEVNANEWFNVWCGHGKACDKKEWVDTYTDNYIAAYDQIVAWQPQARVLISLEHHFDEKYDNPAGSPALLSGVSIIKGVAAKAGDRHWRLAYHPYPPNLLNPNFTPEDYPRITYGNIGVLAGWLRKNYPNRPSAWEIHLTESGVNSIPPQASENAQSEGVCRSFYNVLGTPGIVNYVYHRLSDHEVEVKQGIALGLRRPDGSPKPSWATWALANRHDLNPPKVSCGFENLPYTKLVRHSIPKRGHWTSTRLPPSGAKAEQSWRLLRDEVPGTEMLYECMVGTHNMISKSVNCEGQFSLGPVGYIYKESQANTVPLYRCRVGAGASHFVSEDAKCEGQTQEQLLGYAVKAAL